MANSRTPPPSDNVAEDHTAESRPGNKPLPPGPPDADDIDFKNEKDRTDRGPGFTGVPGAGPNPGGSV